jgi:CheY-like chemotaxis protein
MIVEDEAVSAMTAQAMVTRLGHAVCATAASGEEALKALPDARPALVLMDIMLDGDMDGIETARRIRECANVAICYVTAYTDPETRRRAQATQPAAFLAKPLDQAQLEDVLARLAQ